MKHNDELVEVVAKELCKASSEIVWLRWFYQNCDKYITEEQKKWNWNVFMC